MKTAGWQSPASTKARLQAMLYWNRKKRRAAAANPPSPTPPFKATDWDLVLSGDNEVTLVVNTWEGGAPDNIYSRTDGGPWTPVADYAGVLPFELESVGIPSGVNTVQIRAYHDERMSNPSDMKTITV